MDSSEVDYDIEEDYSESGPEISPAKGDDDAMKKIHEVMKDDSFDDALLDSSEPSEEVPAKTQPPAVATRTERDLMQTSPKTMMFEENVLSDHPRQQAKQEAVNEL